MTAVLPAQSTPPATSFTVVGDGRAGGAFAFALQRAGWQLVHRLRRGEDPSATAADAALVLLTVPDGAIAEVASRITPGPGVVAHVAGSMPLSVLAPYPSVASIHPLMSLPNPTQGASRLLDRCTFAIDGDPIADRVVAALGGVAVRINDEQRTLYHATACVAANHLVALCGQVERLAALVGIPIEAYWRLMSTTLDNVTASGSRAALTGPAARGDWATIRRHLDGLPVSERDSYRTMAIQAAQLAGRRWPEELK